MKVEFVPSPYHQQTKAAFLWRFLLLCARGAFLNTVTGCRGEGILRRIGNLRVKEQRSYFWVCLAARDAAPPGKCLHGSIHLSSSILHCNVPPLACGSVESVFCANPETRSGERDDCCIDCAQCKEVSVGSYNVTAALCTCKICKVESKTILNQVSLKM